jgi:hypothetical protein
MPMRYLLSVVVGTVLVFAWGGFAWAGGLYDRFMRPLPGGEAIVRVLDEGASSSGMFVHPAPIDADSARTKVEREGLEAARLEQFRRGPLVMMALTKGGGDADPARMFVRGALVELFATAMLVAAVALAGSGHGRLRRFLALEAMVAFMALATHMVSWAFMYAPNEWTAVLVFDSVVGWTLAGLPAVFLLRARRPGDALPE